MKGTRLFLGALLGAAAAIGLSCAEPSSPPAPPIGLLGGLDVPTGLLQCTPLPYDSVTQTIGPEGGTIQVGPHSLEIPAGALDTAVTITAVAPSDTVNRIQFQPEGLTFGQYASLTMSYANCDLLGIWLPKRVAYVTPDLLILDYVPSLDSADSQTVRGKLQHFSDYAVAW